MLLFLQVSRGFMAHFYSVCEHTSPLLAWGFLGPDTGDALKPLCKVFKVGLAPDINFTVDVFRSNE